MVAFLAGIFTPALLAAFLGGIIWLFLGGAAAWTILTNQTLFLIILGVVMFMFLIFKLRR